MSGMTVTVGLRGLAVAGAAVVVVAAGAVSLARGGEEVGPASAAAAQEAPEPGLIAMRATGEATGVPDQLTFRFSVRHKADDVADALRAANATTRRVLGALADVGVRRRDVQTTGLSIRPEYDYPASGPAVLTGYAVSQSASVLVRDLAASGATLTATVRAGGNAVRVHGLGLRIGDREALLSRARDEAVATARAKAEQYAAAAGETLGRVRSIKEVRAAGTREVYGLGQLRGARDAVLGSVPVRAGSEDLKVTVAIVWELG